MPYVDVPLCFKFLKDNDQERKLLSNSVHELFY